MPLRELIERHAGGVRGQHACMHGCGGSQKSLASRHTHIMLPMLHVPMLGCSQSMPLFSSLL